MKRPPTGAVFEQSRVVYSEIRAWVAVFDFVCNGMPYECYFVIGAPTLTEGQAHDIMENQGFRNEARKMFLQEVVIAPVIH